MKIRIFLISMCEIKIPGEGERKAAALAKNRILERVQEEVAAHPIEYTVPLGNYWKKKLFVALCNKHQLRTYRYKRQKYSTAMTIRIL